MRVGLNQQNRRQRLLGLSAQLKGSPEQRLLALVQLSGWTDRSVLPLLRRALRDPNLKVVGAAAAAMEPYRTSSGVGISQPAAARRRLPRNAAPRA
jgi:HEAT repeat protein